MEKRRNAVHSASNPVELRAQLPGMRGNTQLTTLCDGGRMGPEHLRQWGNDWGEWLAPAG